MYDHNQLFLVEKKDLRIYYMNAMDVTFIVGQRVLIRDVPLYGNEDLLFFCGNSCYGLMEDFLYHEFSLFRVHDDSGYNDAFAINSEIDALLFV